MKQRKLLVDFGNIGHFCPFAKSSNSFEVTSQCYVIFRKTLFKLVKHTENFREKKCVPPGVLTPRFPEQSRRLPGTFVSFISSFSRGVLALSSAVPGIFICCTRNFQISYRWFQLFESAFSSVHFILRHVFQPHYHADFVPTHHRPGTCPASLFLRIIVCD